MKIRSAVSLYYRLFFVFGMTFIVLAIVLSATFRMIFRDPNAGQRNPILDLAIEQLARELGPTPPPEKIKDLESRYRIRIHRSAGPNGLPAYALSQKPAPPDIEDVIQISLLGFIASLAIVLANSFLVRRILHPIASVADVARKFSEGHLDLRVNVTTKDEIGELSRSFNALADRLQAQIEALKHMAIGLSHEIRSPLARMRVAIEGVSDAKLHELLARQVAEINGITEIILEREALNSGISNLRIELVRCADLLSDLEMHYREAGLVVTIEPGHSNLEFPADRRRLEMWFKNILDNALRYGEKQAQVRVIENADTVEFIVSNEGRSDTNQQSIEKGFGLGLLLCESIARAHGGVSHFQKTDGAAVVTLRLPKETK